MDKMREEFEAYCKSRWQKHSLTFKYDLSYVDDSIEDAWLVWQASRQALVVQLPENGDPVFKNDFAEGVSSGADIYRSAVEYALDKQGIKYK